MRVFCPYVQDTCDEGNIIGRLEGKTCAFYDEDTGVCLVKENMKYSNEQLKRQSLFFNKSQRPVAKSPVDNLLKDIKLGKGGE